MSHRKPKIDDDSDSAGIFQIRNEIAADQLKLGISYFNAYFIEDNCSIAFKWIKLSAEQGNMEAQFRLAELYSLGQGISKSYTDAYKWYTKAAIQGYKKASIRIHNLYQNDIKMQCRGKLNSKEELRITFSYDYTFNRGYCDDEDDGFHIKTETYQYRELYEQRLDDQKLKLNHAIDYYTIQLEKYKASNQEDPEVQQNLGFFYQHGYGVKKYDKWAIEYYNKAAECGYIDSQYQLGCLYQKNTDIKFNYKKAFYWYGLAAKGGNIAAQNYLAYFYEKGLGTDIDYQQALYWYTKSAESGHSRAQLTLGKWYRKGDYVDQNNVTAIKWYTLAARQGNSVAQNCLAQLYQARKVSDSCYEDDVSKYCKEGSLKGRLCSKLQKDILGINDQTVIKKMKTLAKHALIGDGNAMYQIGLKYYDGNDFSKDKHAGFKWIKLAAEAGHTKAIFKMASMYEEGDAVQQDFHKIAIWTKKGAKQKHDKAQCNLGVLYDEGRGVRNDPLEASRWFTFSSNQGNNEALYQLGRLKQRGRGIRKNKKEALELFYLLARQGDINGCYKTGMNYYDEKPENYEATAYKLLEYSATHSNECAQYKLWCIHIDDGDDEKANVHFDKLIHSKNASHISNMLDYDRGIRYSNNHIRHFHLLKRALCLETSTVGDILQYFINTYDAPDRSYLIDMFTLVYEISLSPMEYNIGYLYEYWPIDKAIGYEELDSYTKAIHWYYISAKKGDSRAQVRLGIICEEGKGVDVDFTEAIKYYNLACEKGNADAMYRLAYMHLDGRGISQNFEKAYELYTQASDMGHIEARKVLLRPCNEVDETFFEYKYYQQLVVKTDFDNQIKMLELMAMSGLVAIQYQLGTFYENENDSKAMDWFTLAAQGGVTDACYKLGIFYEEGRGAEVDYIKAIIHYEKAINNKHEDAMYRLARIYLYGKGTETDYKKAYKLYSRAAKLGHISSYNILGANFPIDKNLSNMHFETEDSKYSFDPTSDEFKKKLLMFRHVAEEGDIEVQYKLGLIYESILSSPSYEEAVKWYSMAAKSSHADSMYRLGSLYETGLGVIKNYQKAIDLYSQACIHGSHDALYKLGTMYHRGIGTDIDPEKAVQCYTEGANNGHLESQHMLGEVYKQGLLVEKDTLKALQWFTMAYLKGHDPVRTDLYAMYDVLPYEDYFYDRLNTFLLFQFKKIIPLLDETYNYFEEEEYNEMRRQILYKLGIQYLYGSGINQDYKKALDCLEMSAERLWNNEATDILQLKYNGDKELFYKVLDMHEILFDELKPSRQHSLAQAYYNGVYDTVNQNTASKESMNGNKNIEDGDDMNNKQDTILARDYRKALYYLEKIKGNHYEYRQAQNKIAEMYVQGYGVGKNIEKAIEHYTRASTETNEYAFEIAKMYHFNKDFCDYSKAIEWYKRAGEYRSVVALNILGILYKVGHVVNQDYKTAIQYFIEASKYSYACFNLGLMYYHGEGVKQNYTEAFAYFKKASEDSHGKVQIYLANMYLNGYGTEKNFSEAERWHSSKGSFGNEGIGISDTKHFDKYPEAIEWLKKIEENDPVISLCDIEAIISSAKCNIEKPKESSKSITQSIISSKGESSYSFGKIYYDGVGVQKDYHKAYHYFIEAAEKGSYDARKTLAEMYKEGHGVDKDINKVIEWYTKASKNEPNHYALDIGYLYQHDDDFCDYAKALEWYNKVEGAQKAAALNNIGCIYYSGNGIDKDYERASQYYKESSTLGSEYASCNLGWMYYDGRGVRQSYREAYVLFESVANKNHKGAQEQLATMSLHGQGVDKNINQAIEWYTKAASNGSDSATTAIGELYHSFTEIQDFSKAFESYQKVQGNNTSYALRGVGLLFEYGDGVDQNYAKSVDYYQQSVDLENKGGYYNLALMYYCGRGVDQDYKKCFDLLNESVKREVRSGCTYLFVRIKDKSATNTTRENRVYSLDDETTLYGEIYYQLGIMYKNGQGTDQNDEEARRCFSKAIEYGNEQSKNHIY